MMLEGLTIKKARKMLDEKDISPRELFDAYSAKAKDDKLNAYLELFEYQEPAKVGPLWGIPLAIKDNILIEGRTASAASKILQNYKATYDATVIKKLKEAGAVFLGRTNMDEFAMGSSTENSAYGVVRNPLNPQRVAGGSSGGSAAAVAADMALGALGSDTGSSVRQPAALCGVVGLKPTYGSVSRYGLIAMASSLDVIGTIGKTVEDVKILYDVIKGRDVMDSTSVNPTPNLQPLTSNKIGIPYKFLEMGLADDVKKNFEDAIKKLQDLGYETVEIDLPHIKYALPAYYIIMPAEVSANLARFDGVRYGLHIDGADLIGDYMASRHAGFGAETRRRIMLGTYVLSAGYYDAYYNKAIEVRSVVRREFEGAFENVSAIAMPTSPGPAFKIGEKGDDPVQMYLEDIFTVSANIAGIPAISVPSGTVLRDGKQLPLGLQLIGPHFGEETLFDICNKFTS